MPRYDCVIFDLDGTLIDSSPGIIAAVNKSLQLLGQDALTYAQIKSCIGPPIADTIGQIKNYSVQDKEKFYSVFRPIYSSEFLMDLDIYPGIEKLLLELRHNHILLGIATNKRVDYAIKLLQNIGLSKYFDSINCMDLDGKLKKRDLVEACIKDLDISPAKTVMIGDSENDLNAAITCGTDFIGAGYGYGLQNRSHICNKIVVKDVSSLKYLIL